MTVLVLYFLVGYAAQFIPRLPPGSAQYLNRFVLYVSLPAIIFLKTRDIPLSREALIPILMPLLSFALSFAVFYPWGLKAGWSKGKTGAMILLGGLGNTSFIGFPLIRHFYGEAYITYGLMVDQGGSFITVSTVGLIVASVFSGSSINYKDIAKKVFLFPTTVAFLLALLFIPVDYPAPLEKTLSFLGLLLGPAAMLSVGLQMRLNSLKEFRLEIASVLSLKMLVVPSLYLGLALAFWDLENPLIQITLFEAAMPPMITAGIIAQEYGLVTRLAPSIVGTGILAGFAFLPLWYQLLQVLK